MMLTGDIAALAKEKAGNLTVCDVVLGLGYTAVLLSDGSCGSCFTYRGELGAKCGVYADAGRIAGKTAAELIDLAMSVNLAEASLGVAAINAVLNRDYEAGEDAMNVMDIRPTDKVGMIGYFHPIVQKFDGRVEQLYIFERNLTDGRLYPDWSEDIYLPQCEVVIISGVTFINKTIDHILELAKNAKEIVIMGASACMAPELLQKYGVTVIAGSKVHNAELMLKMVAQGGGGIEVQECLHKLCCRIAPRRD